MTADHRRSRNRGASPRGAPPSTGRGRILLGRLFTLLLVAALLGGAGVVARDVYERLNAQKIEYLVIEGNLDHVTEREVKRALARFTDESLISIDLDEVKAVLEAHPWIRKAALRRDWPDSMVIDVEEHVAIARWGGKGLLNRQGRVFSPPDARLLGHLPYLTGPSGSEQEVMAQYQKFNQVLYPLGLKAVSLNLSRRGAWQLELDNGVEVKVGKEKVIERMRRLASFIDSRHPHPLADVGAIDLRYAKGIAVSRRPAADAPEDEQQTTEEVVSL